MPDEEPPDGAAGGEKPEDPSKGCFACKNMDAYWAEKARTDSSLRDRLAALEKARTSPWDEGSHATQAPEDGPASSRGDSD